MNIQDILSPTNARSEFYNILKAVNENHKPILINGSKSENNAVIIGKEDWDNIQEILNLEYSNVVNQSHKNKAETLYDTIEQQSIIASYGDANSSLWGKRIANDTVAQGHRVFHIVMNGFEYGADEFNIEGEDEETKFVCPPSLERDIGRVDLSKGNLNPIEMFGDVERDKDNKVQIFNTNLNKLKHMFNLMSGRTIQDRQKTMLDEALVTFYRQKHMWTEHPEKYPDELRIYGLKSETIPKMSAFTTQLSDLLLKNISGKDHKIDDDIRDAKHLETVMKNMLSRYRAIVNTITTLPEPKSIEKLQMYYDLSRLSNDSEMMEAQFLNIFSYVMTACEKGDVIMFHGLDKITTETLNIIKGRIDTATRQGIKLVYLFDTIGGSGYSQSKDIEYANLFNTEGILYKDINTDFGFKTLGTMNLKDIVLYKEKIEMALIND